MHSRSTRLLVCRKNDSRNVPDTTVTPLLESSLVSETVFSETVAQTGVSFIAMWLLLECFVIVTLRYNVKSGLEFYL